MNVDHGLAQVGMSQQQLDGAQVGARLEQMSREAPDDRQAHILLRVGHLMPTPRFIQHGEIKEAQGPDHLVDSVAGELALADQMRGVLTNLCGGEPFGRLLEVAGQIVKRAQIGTRGTFPDFIVQCTRH